MNENKEGEIYQKNQEHKPMKGTLDNIMSVLPY